MALAQTTDTGFIKINNVNVYYEQFGRPVTSGAPVLVCIHGYLSSTYSFHKLVPYLANNYSIFALDLPGFGKGEKSRSFVYSLANYANTVQVFMKAFGLANACLVGHSMGGQVALNVAKNQPHLVDRLVLLCSSGYLKPFRRLIRLTSFIPGFNTFVKYRLGRRSIEEYFFDVVYDRAIVDDDMIKGYTAPLEDRFFFHSIVRLLRHHEGDLSTGDLKAIQQPALLLWGKADKIVPPKIGKQLVQDLPHASLYMFDKTGHLLPEEQPERVAKHVMGFVD